VFGNNATGRRAGLALTLYLLVLACMGGTYMGRRLLEPMQRTSALAERFWARGIPTVELAALQPAVKARALESLTRELTGLGRAAGPLEELVKAAERCLGETASAKEGCNRVENLATFRRARSSARAELNLRYALVMWGGAGLVVLACGVLLFALLGRAGRTALGLAMLGFLSLAGMEASAQLDRADAQTKRAALDRLVMKIRLDLDSSTADGRRRLATQARAVSRLTVGKGSEGRNLMSALVRCRADALICPRVLTHLTRFQRTAMARLEPPRSQVRLRGWLQVSAILVLLLIPLLGVLDRRK
jgi:hypothetical protein